MPFRLPLFQNRSTKEGLSDQTGVRGLSGTDGRPADDNILRLAHPEFADLDLLARPVASSRWGNAILLSLVVLLALFGWRLYSGTAYYKYMSPQYVHDLVLAKLWVLVWLIGSIAAVYALRKRPIAPALAVFCVSALFVILFGLAYEGTPYGANGHWGDNGNRMAEIEKMMAYGSFFQDWYLKDLPSFYPPGWFALMAIYAKLTGIEAYQTVKFGYLLVYLVYPWLLFWSWRKLLSPLVSAAIVVATLILAHRFMDWVYYESLTAALFIPWWLYYVERGLVHDNGPRWLTVKEYVIASLIGGALFMIYYYWFFVAAVAAPFVLAARYAESRSWREVWWDVRHKAILVAGVLLVSAVYWAPLLRVIIRFGSESMQNLWFYSRYTDLTHQWTEVSLESICIFLGVFSAFYLWHLWGRGKLVYLWFGGIMVLVLDRIENLSARSIQSRKVLEFVHLFTITPLGVGAVALWQKLTGRENFRRGLIGVGLLTLIVVLNDQPSHTDLDYYKKAYGTVYPKADLAAFQTVDTRGKVYLTQHYTECCYLPYYLFIPLNNMTAHTAGRYSQRVKFLDEASRVSEPELFSYVLAYNRYSSVDYVYLDSDSATGHAKIDLYQSDFDSLPKKVTFLFDCDIAGAPQYFVKKNERGIYEIHAPARSDAMDTELKSLYPNLYSTLTPRAAGV